MGGRLEHEIRLLPQVLSCSFSKDDYVVVLIDPSADPRTIRLAVERMLQEAGSEATVRVVGAPEPVEAAATRAVSPLVATATVATVAAIGVGALVGGLAAADPSHKLSSAPARPVHSVALSPTDSIDALRGVQVSAAAPLRQVQLPTGTADHTVRVLPASRGSAAEATSLTRAIPPVHGVGAAKAASEEGFESSRSARRGGHERHSGKGPPPWSNSSHHSQDHPGKGKAYG